MYNIKFGVNKLIFILSVVFMMVFLLLLSPCYASAAYMEQEAAQPWGFVLDGVTGSPVDGARVMLNGQNETEGSDRQFTITDAYGGFSFDMDPNVDYTIKITADGYETIEVPVVIGTLDILLNPTDTTEEDSPDQGDIEEDNKDEGNGEEDTQGEDVVEGDDGSIENDDTEEDCPDQGDINEGNLDEDNLDEDNGEEDMRDEGNIEEYDDEEDYLEEEDTTKEDGTDDGIDDDEVDNDEQDDIEQDGFPHFYIDNERQSFSSIQDTINAAAEQVIDNNTIYLDGDTYNEDLIIDGSNSCLNGLTIKDSGSDVSTLNGNILIKNLIGLMLLGFDVKGEITLQNCENITIRTTDKDDTLNIRVTDSVVDIKLNGGGGNDTIRLIGNAGEGDIIVDGSSGDDRLIVDFTYENPIPSGGLFYDGGDDYDIMSFMGGSFYNIVYRAESPHSGLIKFDGSVVEYRNIEPISDTTPADNVTFEGTDDDDTIDIIDGNPIWDLQTLEIQSKQFENISFANKKNVIIDGIDGNDHFLINITNPSTALVSLIIRGGNKMDTIEVLGGMTLPGIDILLEAENIIVNDAVIEGKNINLTAEATYGGINPFSDLTTKVELSKAQLIASGNLQVNANSIQQKPIVGNGILEVKKTISKILVTDTVLSAGGNIAIIAKALLDIELNGFLFDSPMEITAAVADILANTIINGTSQLTAGGDILLKAISDFKSASLAKSEGQTGSVAFAVSVIESGAHALLQGDAFADAAGNITIIAQNNTKADTLADGFIESDESGGAATVAVSVVRSSTRAGIYENASIKNSSSLSINAEGRNDINTIAQSAVQGAADSIKDIIKGTDNDGNDIIDQSLQEEICALIDKMTEALDDDESSQSGSSVQGAGAFAYGNLINNNEAGINTTGSIKTENRLDISGKTLNKVSLITSGMTNDGTVGIGAAVGVFTGIINNKAQIAPGVKVEATDINISALSEDFTAQYPDEADAINQYKVLAYAGQSADNVGLGGALAFNLLISNTQALIGENANILLTDGNISIISTNNNEIKTVANGAQGDDDEGMVADLIGTITQSDSSDNSTPAVGIGGAAGITIAVVDTHSYIGDGAVIDGLSDLDLYALSETRLETEAESGAEGGVAAVPVLALSLFVGGVSTKIGTGGELVLDGNLKAEAIQRANNTSKASGKAAGANVGIGTSLALTVAIDKTTATTHRNIRAGGAVTFNTQGVTKSNTTAEAGVKGGQEEEDDDDDEDGDIDKTINDLLSFLKNYSDSQGTDNDSIPNATPQSAETSEGKVNAAGAVALNIAVSSTTAYIPQNITIHSGSSLNLKSLNNVDAKALADAGTTKSDVGVGVAVAINAADVLNEAYIGKGVIVNANGLNIIVDMLELQPSDGEDPDAQHSFSAQSISGAGAGNVGIAGSVAINVIINKALAHADGLVVLTGRDVYISSISSAENTANAGCSVEIGEDGSASVGVGASFATNVLVNDVLAYIDDNAQLTGAGLLNIKAELISDVQTIAIAGADPFTDILGKDPTSEAKYALDAAVALTVVVNTVKAYTGVDSTIDTNGSVEVLADSISITLTRSEGNASGSQAAVGASLGLNITVSDTEAAILGNGNIGGGLAVQATTFARDDIFVMATARGLQIERYLNKFKSTADDILSGKFGNDSDQKKPESAQALDEHGAKTAQTVDQDGGTSGEGSQSQQSVGLAAAVAINVTTHNIKAYTGSGVITVGGDVLVQAKSDTNFETLAAGASVTDGNGISVAVAISNIFNQTTASLGSINGNGNDITIIAISRQNMADEYTSKLGSQAIAGAASSKDGKIGVAGSLGIVNSFAKTNANIAPNARIENAGAIIIKAEETSKLAVRAWAAAGTVGGEGKAGVGAAFAIIYSNNVVSGYVGKGAVVTANALSLTALKHRVNLTDFSIDFDFEDNTLTDNIFEGLKLANFLSSNNYYAEAVAGAASTGPTALAGAFVVIVSNTTTAAYIDDGAVVTVAGNIDITSKSDVNAKAIGGSAAGAEKVGAGLTTVNIINNDKVLAYIGKNAKVISGGNITIAADAEQEFTIIAVSGSGAGNTGLTGVLSIMLTKNVVEAYIGQEAEVKSSGNIIIDAKNDTHAYLIAGGGTGGGEAGVGGSLAIFILLNNTLAYIDQNAVVDADKLLTIKAQSNALNITAVISGSGGGTAGVAASGAIKTIKSNTRAYIGQGAKINTDTSYASSNQAIELSATDNTTLVGISGSGTGGGTAGVGASTDTNAIIKTVKAYIADDIDGDGIGPAQVKAAKNIIITALSSETIVSITAGFAGGGTTGVGGAVAIFVSTNDVQAYIGQGAVVETNGSVAIVAQNDLILVMLAGSGAGGGTAGVGSSVGVSTIINSVKAYIGQGAKVTALGNGDAVSFYTGETGKKKSSGRGLLIAAYSNEDIISMVVGGAGAGSAGVSVTVSTNVINTNTNAYIGIGAIINENNAGANANQEIRVMAISDTMLIGTAIAGAGGGAAGVGGSNDTAVITKTTKAFIDDYANVKAKKNILISARSKDMHVSTTVGGAGGGSAGVGGSVSVSVVNNKTEAYTGIGAALLSEGNARVFATNDTIMALTAGSGAGGGAAGVSGSLAVAVFTSSTRAYLGNGTIANIKGVLEIIADTTENVVATAIGGAGGGAAGVAGSVVVKVTSTTTQAYIGANARINQDTGFGSTSQSVIVRAQDRVISVGASGTGAGGGAAGVGAAADVTIVRNQTSSFIGDGAYVNARKNMNIIAISDKYVNSVVIAGAGGGAAGVAGSISVIAVGALFDSHASNGLSNSEGEGNTHDAVDSQIGNNPANGLLGNSDYALQVDGMLDDHISQNGISGYFDEPSQAALNNT